MPFRSAKQRCFEGLAFSVALSLSLGSGCAFWESPQDLTPPVWQPMAAAPPFCPPFSVGLPKRTVRIKAGDVEGLMWAAANSRSGTDIVLENGRYQLTSNRAIEVLVPLLTIRGASGRRDSVIIEGGGVIFSIYADDFTVADLTVSGAVYHNIQVHGESGVSRTRIYNVHLLDAGQQLIKVSAGDAKNGKFADDGLVACSLIEYSTFNRGSGVTPPDYTDGVDILAGKGWVIRDNVFRRIRSQWGPAGPAILVWKNSMDTVVIRNKIVDCWRGIALGLSPADAYSRGGPATPSDHQNGLVENNVILALHEPADAAIENNFAVNSRVVHNTVYYREGLKHPVNWSIEYRFAPTSAVIQNNLTNLPILKREPSPRQEAVLKGNLTQAQSSWFRDAMAEDMHLTPGVQAVNRGFAEPESSSDFDGTKRPVGTAPDVGAYEFLEPGNAATR